MSLQLTSVTNTVLLECINLCVEYAPFLRYGPILLLGECSALWGEHEREHYGECHKKSSPAQEESDSESTGLAK